MIYYYRRVLEKKQSIILETIEGLETSIDNLKDTINEIDDEELSSYYSQVDQITFSNYKNDAIQELKEIKEKLIAVSKQLLGTK